MCSVVSVFVVGIRYDRGGVWWVEMGEGRPDVRFNVMSVHEESSPSVPRVVVWEGVGDGGVVTPVKPIAGFGERWEAICWRF